MMKYTCLLLLLGCTLSVYSQEISKEQLLKKIEQLENRVTILEKIISDFKKPQYKNNSIIDKQIWRKLNKGMDENNVRELLGDPLTINSGIYTHWYYSKSVSHSFVVFDDENKVNGWNEPEQ